MWSKLVSLLATGVNADGYRELLGMHVATAESTASWTGFFRDLKARGLGDVYLVTSDAHLGIQGAVGDVLPTASWQRCRTHLSKNLSSMVPKTQWPTLSAMFHTMFHTIFQQPRCRRGVGTGPGGGGVLSIQVPSCGRLPGRTS